MIPSPPSRSHPARSERPPAPRSAVGDDRAPTACSIVIRSFNEERHIGRLLAGIMEQTVNEIDIILVDSGSTDATVAIAAQFPVTLVHIDPEDFSFGRSLNLGCAAAKHDILVLASAHVYPVYNDWLEQMLAPFADPNVGLVYGKQRGGETTQYSEHQIFARWFGEETVCKQRHPFCNNANAAVRRALSVATPTAGVTVTARSRVNPKPRILTRRTESRGSTRCPKPRTPRTGSTSPTSNVPATR